ncbi:MAG: 23S rRNA pseudouridine(2604) synthase RluF [Granulosicoccus sp.]
MPADKRIRINKFICESGFCSRKAADMHVERGAVFVNGSQARLGDKVMPGDKVTLDGLPIEPLPADKLAFIALNKPVGVVCTAANVKSLNIVDFVGYHSRIFPVGRLDKNSQGLIFLTNRCDLVNKILGTGNRHEKEYDVTVSWKITETFLAHLRCGVPMLGVVTKGCKVVKLSDYTFRITLVQGLNRQIRRMCNYHGYSVQKLERIRIMHITLSGLEIGQWRKVAGNELSALLTTLG